MKMIVSILCVLIGVAIIVLGGYCSWIMLINGIVNCCEGAKVTPVASVMIAKGVVMVVFCELPFIFGIILGLCVCRAAAE